MKIVGHTCNKQIANTCPPIYSSRGNSQIVEKVEKRPNSHMKISSSDMFLEQYRYILEITLDWLILQNMGKRLGESYWNYASRWERVVLKVQPPFTNKRDEFFNWGYSSFFKPRQVSQQCYFKVYKSGSLSEKNWWQDSKRKNYGCQGRNV